MSPKEAKHQLSLSQWSDTIRDRNNSGLTVKEYCKLNGVSRNAYYYWQRIIRQDLLDHAAVTQTSIVEIGIPDNPTIAQPIPFSAVRHPDTENLLEMTFNDITLRVTDKTSSELLARTLEVIRHVE